VATGDVKVVTNMYLNITVQDK